MQDRQFTKQPSLNKGVAYLQFYPNNISYTAAMLRFALHNVLGVTAIHFP